MGAATKKAPKVKWKKPVYRKLVEKMLRDYPAMKEAIQDREMIDLLPSCVPVYGEEMISSGNSPFASSTERYGIKRAERRSWERYLWVQKIEKAMILLDGDERMVIEKTYFDGLCAVMVCYQLNMSERSYRRIKSRAIEKIALVLNLI